MSTKAWVPMQKQVADGLVETLSGLQKLAVLSKEHRRLLVSALKSQHFHLASHIARAKKDASRRLAGQEITLAEWSALNRGLEELLERFERGLAEQERKLG